MIASENVLSPLAREFLVSDFSDRYAEGHPGARFYQGTKYIDMIETQCELLSKAVFRCSYADVRPISGTTANMAVLFALARPGDPVTAVSVDDGAHISHNKMGAAGVRGVKVSHYPWNTEDMNIDVDKSVKMIRDLEPRLAIFGQSVFLFPTPLQELADAVHEGGGWVWYDGAHVLGLIAGGKFQDPLREGADILTGSTHKTFPGPQRGLLLGDLCEDDDAKCRKVYKKIDRAVFPGVVSSHHLNTMAALSVTLAEFQEYGEAYASQVVLNAKTLAGALHEKGFAVLGEDKGFTESHIILLDVSDLGGGAKVARKLEDANIITNMNMIPGDRSALDPSGIRLGVQELTRVGFKADDMADIADIFGDYLGVGDSLKDPSVGDEDWARARVWELKREHLDVEYCYGGKHKAYEYHTLVGVDWSEGCHCTQEPICPEHPVKPRSNPT